MSAATVVFTRPGWRFGVALDPVGFVVVDLERGCEPVLTGPGLAGHFYSKPDACDCARQLSRAEPVHYENGECTQAASGYVARAEVRTHVPTAPVSTKCTLCTWSRTRGSRGDAP